MKQKGTPPLPYSAQKPPSPRVNVRENGTSSRAPRVSPHWGLTSVSLSSLPRADQVPTRASPCAGEQTMKKEPSLLRWMRQRTSRRWSNSSMYRASCSASVVATPSSRKACAVVRHVSSTASLYSASIRKCHCPAQSSVPHSRGSLYVGSLALGLPSRVASDPQPGSTNHVRRRHNNRLAQARPQQEGHVPSIDVSTFDVISPSAVGRSCRHLPSWPPARPPSLLRPGCPSQTDPTGLASTC